MARGQNKWPPRHRSSPTAAAALQPPRPTVSPADVPPDLPARADDEPGNRSDGETTAGSLDSPRKDESDSAEMESDASDTAVDRPSPADAARPNDDALPDQGAPPPEMPAEMAADIDPNKPPVPSENDQAQAMKAVRAKHKTKLAKAKTADERVELANTLLTEARNMGDNSPKRYAVFMLAIDLAAAAGNFALTADGWNDLAERFQVNALVGRWKTLEKSSKTKQVEALQTGLRQLFDDATDKDRYDLAGKALTLLAKSDPDNADQYESERKSFDALVASYGQAKAALEQLKTDPADPKANRTAGEFLSFGKRDWSAGLLLLSRSDDPVLKRLAARELAQPVKPKAQVQLADSWWEFAEQQADTRITDSAKSRARFWYMEALPELTGADRTKAENRATLEARVYGEPASNGSISSASFEGKLQGKAIYDAETGRLTLAYDFHDEAQLKDFEGDASRPPVSSMCRAARPCAMSPNSKRLN